MNFRRYNSIENSYREKHIHKIVKEGHSGGNFVVQEKIHGSNFSLWVNDGGLKAAKRSGFIDEGENFNNHSLILNKYKENMTNLLHLVRKKYPKSIELAVFGEIYGGNYPHKDVERVKQAVKIQTGVFYRPDNDFIGFDILIRDGKSQIFLDVIEVNELLSESKIPFVSTLFVGPFDEALKYPNEFVSTIPKNLRLPEIKNNLCEGVVIRPIKPKFLFDGTRVILKNKNEKFTERSHSKGSKTAKKPIELTDEALGLLGEVELYSNENRLKNVLSKVGTITDKDFGKITGLLNKDALEDFNKDHSDSFSILDKKEQKYITKHLGQINSQLIRKNFLNIIDGSF